MTIIRAIFFDAVGTLIHPEPAAHLVYADVGRRFGSRHGPDGIKMRFARAFQRQEEIDRAAGWTTSEARERKRWRDIVGEVLDDVADAPGCFETLYAHFARPGAWRCDPEAAELFRALQSRGVVLGLATNLDERIHGLVGGLEPLHFLRERIVLSSAVGYRKPAREFFQGMGEITKLAAEDILHVGDDMQNDIEGARGAGLNALLFDPRDKKGEKGVLRIRRLAEIAAMDLANLE